MKELLYLLLVFAVFGGGTAYGWRLGYVSSEYILPDIKEDCAGVCENNEGMDHFSGNCRIGCFCNNGAYFNDEDLLHTR